MIDFTVNKEVLRRNIREARKHHIILPTIAQQKDPSLVPAEIREQLKNVGMQAFSPLNLFRITWKNEPKESGGTFGKPNIIELPRELTGVRARIFCLLGKWFPTGCHKVGAAYGCMVPKLVTEPEPHGKRHDPGARLQSGRIVPESAGKGDQGEIDNPNLKLTAR